MAISVTEPISRALTRTREVLFDPFDLAKWFKLGFCAFLAHLGNSSGGGGGNFGSWEESDPGRQMERAGDWARENWGLVLTVGSLVLLVILAVTIALLWLQARGRFMFLDGVVKNRGAVVEPWKTHRAAGNSVFWFKLILTVIGFVTMLLIVGIGLGIAWADIDARIFGAAAWGGVLIGGGLFLVFALSMLLIDVFLTDFVIPAMYARGIGVMDGWRVVRREVFAAYPGPVVLYVLMKFLISLVIGAIVLGVVCVTLCVAACCLAIPYIGTVLMLPVLVFGRCYSLFFLDQLGGAWQLFSQADEPEETPEPSPS